MMQKTQHRIFGLALFLTLSLCVFAQAPHQVINSAGGERSAPGGTLTLTDNVGEVFVQTVNGGTNTITQGFLQNFSILPDVSLDLLINHVTCRNKKDGNISTSLSNSNPSYTIAYIWSDTTLCPSNNCSRLDSLSADTLFLTVLVTRPLGGGNTITDSIVRGPIIILDVNPPCDVTVYSGVTANNDNVNDYFHIKNIEQYPDNRLSIYNRWGALLFDRNGYDNTTVRWPEDADLRTLTSGTYFYVLELGDGGKPIKGWIELLKN